MAIIQSNGVLTVSEKPIWTPTSEQARLARLQNTLTFYYYNDTAWVTCRLDMAETYTGDIIPDNATLTQALQSLETAIQAITLDGNHVILVRANTIENVEPSGVEVPSPILGDTADVHLTNGLVEKWSFNGTIWQKGFTIDYNDVTNLGYTASATQGVVTSSTGSNATIPAGSTINASLMLPADKAKADFISVTQAVDLDNIESTLATAVQTVANTNSILMSKAGTQISAQLQLSATQGTDMSVTVEADGLRVVYSESSPPSYVSKASATIALGINKKFKYTKTNLDGATENSVSWT